MDNPQLMSARPTSRQPARMTSPDRQGAARVRRRRRPLRETGPRPRTRRPRNLY